MISAGNIYVLKNKKDVIYFEAGDPPKKNYSSCYQSGPLSFEYFFDEQKAINLEMYINVSRLIQSDSEFESYRFKWWCEDENDFFIKRPTYKREGEITARLQGHQLIRDCSYLSDSSGISNIRQVDEHELIFESNYDNWHVLEHTRLIDQDKFRSRTIYSWFNDKLKIVENHHETRIKNPN